MYMGLNSIPSHPITSEQTINSLSAEIRKLQESYYLIFHIILESGMPLNRVIKLKVKDLYRKPKLEYASRHNTSVFKVAISLRLQRDIMNYLKGRPLDSFAFVGVRSDKPMMPTAFQYALQAVSEKLGIEPAVTSTSLRKTFIYNTVVSDGNYVRAAQFTHSKGPKGVVEYLGIGVPDEITYAQASKDFTKATQRNALNKTREKILAALDEAEHLVNHRDDRTIENMTRATSLLQALSNTILDLKL